MRPWLSASRCLVVRHDVDDRVSQPHGDAVGVVVEPETAVGVVGREAGGGQAQVDLAGQQQDRPPASTHGDEAGSEKVDPPVS